MTVTTVLGLLASAPSLGSHPLYERLVRRPLELAWTEAVARLPTLGSAIAVGVLLWLLARLVRALAARLLRMSRLDRVVEDTWFGRILSGLGEGFTPSKAIASLLYVAILMLALAACADILGLSAVRNAMMSALAYVPRLASALCLVAAGGYVAKVARRAVASVMNELKSPYGGIAESATEGLILLLTITVAVNSLGADLSFITNNLAIIVAVLVVTTAFLFGWSMRRPAEEIIANYYLRRLVRVGDRVTLANVEGVVERFTALGLLLKDDGGLEHFLPARHVLDGVQRSEPAGALRRK